MSTFVTMSHPEIATTATATSQAFEDVWESLGWSLVTADPIVTTYGATMRHRKSWLIGVRYFAGDVVHDGGTLYVAIRSSQGVPPSSSADDWDEIVDSALAAEVDGGTA